MFKPFSPSKFSISIKSASRFSFCSGKSFYSFADSSSINFRNVNGPQSSNSNRGSLLTTHTFRTISFTSFYPQLLFTNKTELSPSFPYKIYSSAPSTNYYHTNIQQSMTDTWGLSEPSLILTPHTIPLESLRFSPSLSIPWNRNTSIFNSFTVCFPYQNTLSETWF